MEKRFYIDGMTCSGCEQTLERAASGLPGVTRVRADRRKGVLDTEFAPPCTEEDIVHAVENAGYSVIERPRRKADAVYILVILLDLYLIAWHFGWTEVFRAFPTVGGTKVGYAALFLIGLMTSVHCIAMCGGLNLAQSMQGETRRPIRSSVLYNLGRLTSYTLIGGLLGLIGEAAAITLRVRGVIGLAAGVLMLCMGISILCGFELLGAGRFHLPAPLQRWIAALRQHGSFAIGLANGLMPCGSLQSMQIYAIACGSFLGGAAAMFSFCLGTIPLVLLFGAAAGMLKKTWRTAMLRVGAALLILLGLVSVQNNLVLTGIPMPWASSSGDGTAITALTVGGIQYVTTTLRVNGYDDIQVTAGIPVVWIIQASEESLNGCNSELVLPAFDQQIRLQAGENTITFTPEEPGVYTYSCWMGMLQNTITVTAA